jgi:hypothetical protein
MFTSRRLAKVVPALALLALAIPTSAFGQATRTWVSGVGDDANPCSRTAPCKTFAGAISKTAPGGEINCIDPGGFGALTINKSLTIKCYNTLAGVLVSGTNGIVVNAAATDKVTLVGLDINGLSLPSGGTSLAGVKVISAKAVSIINDEIYGFQAGIDVVPTASVTRVVVARSHIHDNGVGIFAGPGNGANTATSVTARYNDIQDNICGVAATSFGANAGTPNANADCGAAGSGSGLNATAVVGAYHNGINDNGQGVYTRGSLATAEMAFNEVTGNSVFGLHRVDGGHIKTFTPATNAISNNAASDAPDQTTPLTKRVAKRLAG